MSISNPSYPLLDVYCVCHMRLRGNQVSQCCTSLITHAYVDEEIRNICADSRQSAETIGFGPPYACVMLACRRIMH